MLEKHLGTKMAQLPYIETKHSNQFDYSIETGLEPLYNKEKR